MNRSPTTTRRPIASATALVTLLSMMAVQVHARADGAADEADLHFELGTAAYEKGMYSEALEHYLLSNRIVPNRNVVYNIAIIYDALKRYADAYRYFVDALEGETDPEQIAKINNVLARIAQKVAVLRVESEPAGATIYLNRKDLGSRGHAPKPLAVPEGMYDVIVELPGYEPITMSGVKAQIGSETIVRPVLRPIVGRVKVTLEGASSAAVFLDDELAQPRCIAPCSFDAPPGSHQLHLRREGFQAAPQPIVVEARETVTAAMKMSPLTGSVVVQADEREAVVEIDGKAAGFTPAVIQNVSVGTRQVRVTLRGYDPIVRAIEVRPNQQTQLLDLTLLPSRNVLAASRFDERVDDAPASVTIIDNQELRAFGYPTLWEALRGIRGIALSNDRTYTSASIRGLGQPNDYGNRMLVMQDGASLNDNLLNSTYIGTDGRPDLQDVERIEVVRGPTSLLYGANAMSGVVNIVQRNMDRPNSAHVSVGTYDNAVMRARAGFHHNFTPEIGVWASVAASRSDGFAVSVQPKSTDEPTSQIVQHADAHRAYGVAGRVWAGPFTVQWYYNQNMHVVPIGAYGSIIGDRRTFLFDERFLGEARFEPKLTSSLQLLIRAHANHYNYDGEYIFSDNHLVEDLKGTWFGGEGRLVWKKGNGPRITLGGEAQAHVVASILGRTIYGETYVDQKHPYRVLAPYLLADWGPTPWLRLSAGIRYNRIDYDGPIKDTGTPVVQAAAIVKPTKQTTLKLMGGNAFRAASIYEQFYTDGGAAQAPATDPKRGFFLGPEQIYTGELELTQRFLTDWSMLFSGWISRVDGLVTSITVDKITGAPNPDSGLQRYVNRSEPALLRGVDIELRREWRQGFFLSAFYSHQRAQYVPALNDIAVARDPRLINAPEHLAAFRCVLPVLAPLASVGLRVNLEAPRRISLSQHAVTGYGMTADLTLSGTLRRYGLGYVLGLYNIADQRYDYINAASYSAQLTPQNGRTILVNLTGQYPP